MEKRFNICLSVLSILFFTLCILAISLLPSSSALSKNGAIDPDNVPALLNKGATLNSLGKYNEAISSYESFSYRSKVYFSTT